MALGELQVQLSSLDPVAPRWSNIRKIFANAQMGPRDVKKFCQVDAAGEKLLETAVTRLGMSARAYDRILKVGRTIADLAGEAEIAPAHLSEAIQYRAMDRYY